MITSSLILQVLPIIFQDDISFSSNRESCVAGNLYSDYEDDCPAILHVLTEYEIWQLLGTNLTTHNTEEGDTQRSSETKFSMSVLQSILHAAVIKGW